MTEDSTYITPTKERPIFKCHNDYFGYIEQDFYKDFEIKNEQVWIIGSTFATSLTDAIVRCHDFIKEHPETNPKSKFIIEMVDGSINKYGDVINKKCYSISMKQAKEFHII